MKFKKIVLAISICLIIVLTRKFELSNCLTLDYIQEHLNGIQAFVQRSPLLSTGAFFAVYIAVTALSIPGATVMTLTAGALFGLFKGTLIVSFASSIGATLSFLVSRYLFKQSVEQKYENKLSTFNLGIEKNGALYLFSLRLIPAFPFFLINILMGVTSIKTAVYYIVSQVGMLPGTIVYVNAGKELAGIKNVAGIVSPSVLFSFCLLALFPFLAKFVLKFIKIKTA